MQVKRPERRIINGNLEAIILSMANSQELHGYRVIQKILKERRVYLGASTVYPLMKEMQRKGLLSSRWDTTNERPRKVYSITEKGKVVLRTMAIEIQAISSEVAKVLYI